MRTFDGFWPALLTPYTPDDRVNVSVLQDLVDYHLAKRVTGFYICGSTGEGAFLTLQERLQVTETVLERVAGRVPVIVQVGAAALVDAAALARHAAGAGAAGISSILPPVVYDGRGIVPYLERLAAAAPGLPFFPYLFGGTRDSLTLLRELAHIPNFAGTKYYGPNTYELGQIVRFRSSGWTVFSGMDEQALPGIMYGAAGVIGSTLNFMPGVYRRILECYAAGDWTAARTYQEQANRIIAIMAANYFAGSMRAALSLVGLEVGQPRLPNPALAADRAPAVLALLKDAGLPDLMAL